MRALFGIWVWLISYLLAVPVLSLFVEIPEEDKHAIRIMVAFLATIIYLLWYLLTQLHMRLERESGARYPRPPDGQQKEPESSGAPLELKRLVLLIREKEGKRFSLEVYPTDVAIRPYVEFYFDDKETEGKQATMLFQIANPRRRTVFDWECKVPFTFKSGLNKVWPPQEEFSVLDQIEGTWRLKASFVVNEQVIPWEETTFSLREPLDLSAQVGADATLSYTARQEIGEAIKGRSVDDLLDEL